MIKWQMLGSIFSSVHFSPFYNLRNFCFSSIFLNKDKVFYHNNFDLYGLKVNLINLINSKLRIQDGGLFQFFL